MKIFHKCITIFTFMVRKIMNHWTEKFRKWLWYINMVQSIQPTIYIHNILRLLIPFSEALRDNQNGVGSLCAEDTLYIPTYIVFHWLDGLLQYSIKSLSYLCKHLTISINRRKGKLTICHSGVEKCFFCAHYVCYRLSCWREWCLVVNWNAVVTHSLTQAGGKVMSSSSRGQVAGLSYTINSQHVTVLYSNTYIWYMCIYTS